MNPTKDFSIATVSCFDVPLQVLRGGVVRAFDEHGMKVSVRQSRIEFSQFGPEPQRGPGQKKAALWSTSLGEATASFMLSNLADGWMTLANAASLRLGCRCWRFTVSDENATFPRNAISFTQAGVTLRVVSAQLDDPSWVFYEKGPQLEVEDGSQYKRRRIRDRVTRGYVISVAERLGFQIGSDAFWKTDESGLHLTENR